MMRGYHQSIAKIERIDLVFGIPLAHARGGEAALFLPFDHMVWTGRVAEVAAHVASLIRAHNPDEKLILWTPGTITGRARAGLSTLGIEARQRSDAALPLLD